MIIETVNLNVWPKCDLVCEYCYGGFPDRPTVLPLADWYAILDQLVSAGVRRVTFCGGEPTLQPDLLDMLRYARQVGLHTSIVTNGARLTNDIIALLDVVGMTLDSTDSAVLRELGRTTPAGIDYFERFLGAARRTRVLGVLLKVNTVVTQLNLGADLSAVLIELRPYKWKPLQFTTVVGENDARAERLRVSNDQFACFVERHRQPLEAAGIWVAPETELDVQSTYAMIDPSGRMFQTTGGTKQFSEPVLDVGLNTALEQAGGYDRRAFLARGGHLDVRRLPAVGAGGHASD